MNQSYLEKMARLAILKGADLQKGQPIMIRASVEPEHVRLARLCAQEAWKAGASDVLFDWRDPQSAALEYEHKDLDAFSKAPVWKTALYEEAAKNNACFLMIDGDDPDAFGSVDPRKTVAQRTAMNKGTKTYRDGIDKGILAWSIVAAPSAGWARKVYPDLDEKDAIEKLWADIFAISRIDDNDPLDNWQNHNDTLQKRLDKLNQAGIVRFHYTSENGTDLWVDLPENASFIGGASKLADGRKNYCNIPTEELFSVPYKYGVNGTLESVMPLNSNGKTIEGFGFTFKDGKVVDYHADTGKDVLDALLSTDEGSRYLGEIALVDKDSPIRKQNRIFFQTLFDENASCHFALGQSYAECVEGAAQMSDKELKERGLNQSDIHVDFMVGADDLKIDGYTKDGEIIPVFENGRFTGEFDL